MLLWIGTVQTLLSSTMPMSPHITIKNVIFDLGGVLIDWNPRYLYRKLFPDEASVSFFIENVCTQEWNAKQDAGRPLSVAVEEKVAEWPAYRELIEAYYVRWDEMISGPNWDTVRLLELLYGRDIPLYALTNWSAETLPPVRSKHTFFNCFRDIVVSGEEKMLKPDAAFFDLCLKRNNLCATETLFIDDHMHNVEAARAVGLYAVLFTTAKQLRIDLENFGLLNRDHAQATEPASGI